MKFKTIILILLFLSLSLLGSTIEEKKELNLSAAGIESFDADCGSGYLKITGEEGLKQIEVKATIEIRGFDKEDAEFFIKDKMTLSLEKRGDTAYLVSKVKSSIFKKPKSALINLDIRIPKNLALDIDDGSGSLEITGIDNDIELEDGSGTIKIKNISGKVKIDDGSGSIYLQKISGNVEIEDGSGSLEVEGIKGDLEIDDSSGEIKVKDISGNVKIDDSSGDMTISKIGGSVVVQDGSGGIDIDGVEKDVTIKSAGSGSVSIQNVKGKVKK
jgi:DUF4097 and DUF4098 domain-containing protein YvlB